MNFFNNYYIGKRKSFIEKGNLKKIIVIFFLGVIIISNFILIQNQNNKLDVSNKNFINEKSSAKEINHIIPKISNNDPSELQDPFTKNFSYIWDYFETNHISDLTDYDIDTYIRGKSSGGTTIDNGIYSLDNLLLYNSLLDFTSGQNETLEAYVKLKDTPLWYENTGTFEYGFVGTIDGTSGDITDNNRYLIDNVMPIFMLVGDGTEYLDKITYSGENAKNSLEETFLLVNSSLFFNVSDNGFLDFNSTSSGSIYQMKSNFYTVLAYYQIYKNRDYVKNSVISDDNAYQIANSVMQTLVDKMWDYENKGFYKSARANWDVIDISEDIHKYLDVNALGIMALLNYWVENEEMRLDSPYYKNATALYDELEALYDVGNEAYRNVADDDWDSLIGIDYNKFDAEANALMMRACLNLFELTGNITYYDRALKLYNTFETKLFDISNNAYETSFGTVVNPNFNLTSNLIITESYLKAFDIYNSTVIDATFNITEDDYIFNQDTLNLTCDYAFEKTFSYLQPSPGGTNTTRYNNITTGGVITYAIRYPNETIVEVIRNYITSNTTNLIYPITDALPVGNGYSISIKANSTIFGVAFATKTFNVKYGLEVKEISGLDDINEIDEFYQGQTGFFNITIESLYNYNITLNISVEASGIINYTRTNLLFENKSDTLVQLNVTALFSAVNGSRTLSITFKNGTILYLDIVDETIFISDALTYSNLLYSKDVVPGNSIQVSLELKNYLPNDNQLLNLTFTGEYVIGQNLYTYNLSESEVRIIKTSLISSRTIDVDSFEITMNILKDSTVIKSEILTVNVLPEFEIVSLNYPEKVLQGVPAQLILIIKNNKEQSQEFTLIINDKKADANIEELVKGENRIEVEVVPTINPYEIGYIKFHIELEDDDDEIIVEDYIESEIQLTAVNLLLFYVLPIIICIGIILYYKNKEIKLKLLRR